MKQFFEQWAKEINEECMDQTPSESFDALQKLLDAVIAEEKAKLRV